ncbi:MAG TPA: peptidyl-prolyl cis-trans isomerase [Candidatus Manganitrophaceae bacterium]|nr:peptidyl-prolyl cis-trans isomerase [Candidatus Manganitrophaceae bacterium]
MTTRNRRTARIGGRFITSMDKRRLIRAISGTLCLLLLLLSVGCRRQKPAPLLATVALVNDEAITFQELAALVSKVPSKEIKEDEATAEEKEELKKKLLEQLIERKMLLQEARRLKIQLTEGEVERKFEEIRDGKSKEAFLQFLSEQNITRENWEKTTKEDLLIEKLLNQLVDDQISLTDGEMLQYYNAHAAEWRVPDQIKFRQIVVESQEEAETVLRSLMEGADFVETARSHSQFPDQEAQADSGYLSRSEIPEEFEPLFQAEIGSISPVIKTPFGYHLVKLEERRPARTLPFEESREKIHQILLEEKREVLFSRWIENVRRKTEVKINEELLRQIS